MDFPYGVKPTTPCREFRGRRTAGGYGVRGDTYVHRWVVAQIDGEDAIKGKVVMHLCDNRACFRYDHLRVGTVADNNRDMIAKGRSRHHGKEQKIRPDQHAEIAARHRAGETQTALAAEYGASTSQINRIMRSQGVPMIKARKP
jgi:hypothetical protein